MDYFRCAGLYALEMAHLDMLAIIVLFIAGQLKALHALR